MEKAIEAVKSGLSLRKAEEKFGIPRCTINRAVRGKNAGKVGRPFVFSENDETSLVGCICLAGDWGFPLTVYDIRLIVKAYLDRSGRTEHRFQNNMPGRDFVLSFLQRHKDSLSNKMCQNIKRSRAQVDEDAINQYFDELEQSTSGIAPSLMINYDETNMTDDPGCRKVVVRRGCRHPERIIDSSKTSTSVMFSASANGVLLPPYVTYKAENLYNTWTENGPKGCVYNRSKSGWFTIEIFKDWFRKIALPYLKKFADDAKKVMIGDNLASHISPYIIDECRKNNISFILLPPNSTGITKPLDVAFFRPLKVKWRQTLEEWKSKNRGTVPKDTFPRLLKKCLEEIGNENISKNIMSGFTAAGLVPLDREKVLKRLPKKNTNSSENEEAAAGMMWVSSFTEYLEESRKKETENVQKKPRKKKINVPAGRGINVDDLVQLTKPSTSKETEKEMMVTSKPKSFKNKGNEVNISKPKRRVNNSIDEESSDCDSVDKYSVRDSDSDLILSVFTDDNFSFEEDTTGKSDGLNNIRCEVKLENLSKDTFVIVDLVFDKNTKKENVKQFYAQVLKVDNDDKINLKFLRKSSKSPGNVYVFPLIDDEMELDIKDIVTTVVPINIQRGRYTFPFAL